VDRRENYQELVYVGDLQPCCSLRESRIGDDIGRDV
jgi:hypothetical protein